MPTKATYIPPAMLIYLADPLNFLVWSLTLSVCTKLKSVQKGRNAKRGVGVQGAKSFFEVGPKKEKCKKGGGYEKGGCKAAPYLGAKIFFSGASRTHPPFKNPVYAPVPHPRININLKIVSNYLSVGKSKR